MAENLYIDIMPEDIVGIGVHKNNRGYNSAYIDCKKGKREYLSIRYEWESEDEIPDFVMEMMSFMSSNKKPIEKACKENAKEFEDFKNGTDK